jgi:hypothetical protein
MMLKAQLSLQKKGKKKLLKSDLVIKIFLYSMKIARIKFVVLFLIFAAAFVFGSNSLLDQPPELLWGSESQVAWKSVVAKILSPIKIILMGPLVPFINFLHQDPDTPPPFFLAGFVIYWTILALIIYYVISKIKKVR